MSSPASTARRLIHQAGMRRLVAATAGRPDVSIALIDGPVYVEHPSLAEARIVIGTPSGVDVPDPFAVAHATFLASMLVGRRGAALGLCRRCTLVSFPVVGGAVPRGEAAAGEIIERLATAVRDAVARGAAVIQLSLDFSDLPEAFLSTLVEAIAEAAAYGVRTVAAAGNTAGPTASPVLTAPGVVPVASGRYDGSLHSSSSWGMTIGACGLLAPGEHIVGAVPPDGYVLRTGSSYAASFVTGAFALLRSLPENPHPDRIWTELLAAHRQRRTHSLVPAALDADLSHDLLAA